MRELLKLTPPQAALNLFLSHLPPAAPPTEIIPTHQAVGRISAQSMLSPEILPAFARSTMDGYAVHAADTIGASEALPLRLLLIGEIPMGGQPTFEVEPGQAAVILTGGMLPVGADAVLMLEYTQLLPSGDIDVFHPVSVTENIVLAGEDITRGEEIISKGVRLRPADIGGLLALGITQISVTCPPLVGILSSGDEVISPDAQPLPGQVRDINTYTLSALIQQCGARVHAYGVVPDWKEALRETMRTAHRDCDIVVVTAGSSASARDLTAETIAEMGQPGVLVHGINIRPGKPSILAVCDGKPIVGLPGNPVSALVIAGLFITPLIETWMGLREPPIRPQVSARLAINLTSQADREEWIPVRLSSTPQGYLAEPIFFKSALIFNLSRADGLLHIPAAANRLNANEMVQVYLF